VITRTPGWEWLVDAAYYRISRFDSSGKVWQFKDPAFDNFDYKYKYLNQRIMFEAELMKNVYKRLSLYGQVGIGYSDNCATDYRETPTTTTAVAMKPFADKDTSAFAYEFGIGVAMTVNQYLAMQLGYQFAGLGDGELGLSPDQNTSDHFQVDDVHTHNVLFTLIYKFNKEF